jgi:hypothetical protein
MKKETEELLRNLTTSVSLSEEKTEGFFHLSYIENPIEVRLSFDEDEDCSMEELAVCFEKFIAHFRSEEVLSALRKQIAEETIEAAFEQSDEEPSEKDVLELYDNLHFVKVGVYCGCYVLHFRTAPDELDITIQLNDFFEFEDYT